MIKTITSRLACMALLLLASASALAQPAQKRLALLIGNSAYQSIAPLSSPSKDVDAMESLLVSAGFEVIKVKDATRRAIKENINTFTDRLKNYDVGMFYYSGHGLEVDGINYIVPIDLSKLSSNTNKIDIEDECVKTDYINAKMNAAGALNKTYILVLDACRNSPFKGFKDIGEQDAWRQPSDIPSGSIVCYAASGGQKAADGSTGQNSPYTTCFIKHAQTKDIKIEDVFKRVRIELTGTEAQVPEERNKLNTDFYFFKSSTPTSSTTTPAGTSITPPVKVVRAADRDLDGVADTEDRCPDNYGIADKQGCPDDGTGSADYDNDGLADDEDACPTEVGTIATQGCPDKDNDGVPDKADKCLNAKGDARWEGCPDTDGDGIPDHKDNCINERGTSVYGGCPPPAAVPSATSGTYTETGITPSFKMIAIPAGTFTMGSNEGEADEKPTHQVTLSSFYMGETEVTVEQFRAFINATNYKTDAEKIGTSKVFTDKWEDKSGVTWRNSASGGTAEDSHPVIHVSWNDAKAYCDWLNSKCTKQYRLPTEAEWEYAAGNGSKHTTYSWGNGQPSAKQGGNVTDESKSPTGQFWKTKFDGYNDGYWFTAPVKSYTSNEFGLYDMTGNVNEWCSDWYGSDYYGKSTSSNPTGASSGTFRVFRGGGWNSSPSFSRVAYRSNGSPSYRGSYLGFRLVSSSL